MEKFNYKVDMSDELKKEKENLCRYLLNEPSVQEFLQIFELPEMFVYENTYLLKDYVKRKKKCDVCVGLEYCQQEVKGHLLSLKPAGIDVEKVLVPCRYKTSFENAIAHKTYFTLNDMSEQQMQYRLEDIDLDIENDNYVLIYQALFKDIFSKSQDPKDAKGFFLCGEPGVGKTYLACCYINEVARTGKYCAFVHVPTLIANLKSIMYDNVAFRKTIHSLKNANVLVLDDIGGESASTWTRDDILLPLLNDRMEKNKKTLFTSNCNFEEIEEFYRLKSRAINDAVGAKRLVERMKALADEKVLKGINRRTKNNPNY
ncbi:ATP-binding protein [Breznakia pachnodae]|uniref:Primosomal protein DnaI n=1 Tax=Breznakia pachnodae TaxID=265178 RepID=A0ABU0E7J4_9FIRM|nr:ATP-binding protein [Breznakia pachnodae]MDQ0362775.1 primosomal protein DnaI [Breznakia pachnodae]